MQQYWNIHAVTALFTILCATMGAIHSAAVPKPAVSSTASDEYSSYGVFIQSSYSNPPQAIVNFKPEPQGGLVINVEASILHGSTAYKYHIHQYPVPSNGDCKATGDHYDPTGRNAQPEGYKPTPGSLDSYERGDISGKFGPLFSTPSGEVYSRYYYDPTLSLQDVKGKSIVFHDPSGARIMCGNIVKLESGYNGNN
ncbi:superoxide dismutase [Paraphysoderma sedebokerense]|nr:superoxide dismutase [Paraphysoderma sedebokerense]